MKLGAESSDHFRVTDSTKSSLKPLPEESQDFKTRHDYHLFRVTPLIKVQLLISRSTADPKKAVGQCLLDGAF